MITYTKRWATISTIMGALVYLFTPTASAATSADCQRTARADWKLCEQVRAQRAYGWTNSIGTPTNWVVKGTTLVHEITHQGLTKAEMHSYLTGQHNTYRYYVTNVSFNVDAIAKKCGHRGGSGNVAEVAQGGRSYTFRLVACN